MKKIILSLGCVLAGCATVPHSGSGGIAIKARPAEPGVQRLDTSAGAFLVRDSVAADFQRLLAGEPTQHRYYAGGVLAE